MKKIDVGANRENGREDATVTELTGARKIILETARNVIMLSLEFQAEFEN